MAAERAVHVPFTPQARMRTKTVQRRTRSTVYAALRPLAAGLTAAWPDLGRRSAFTPPDPRRGWTRAAGFRSAPNVCAERRLDSPRNARAADRRQVARGVAPFYHVSERAWEGAVMDGRCTCRGVRFRLTSDPLFVHCCH